jgi:hypothetical protein
MSSVPDRPQRLGQISEPLEGERPLRRRPAAISPIFCYCYRPRPGPFAYIDQPSGPAAHKQNPQTAPPKRMKRMGYNYRITIWVG